MRRSYRWLLIAGLLLLGLAVSQGASDLVVSHQPAHCDLRLIKHISCEGEK